MKPHRMKVFGALLAVAVLACSDGGSGLPRGEVTIRGTTVGVDVANTPSLRAKGLSGRPSLAEGEGMLFLHEEPGRHGYWMKAMNFEIDILWLRTGRIVDIAHRAAPLPAGTPDTELPVHQPRTEADAVLEVPGGFARMHGWDVGSRVEIALEE